MPCRLKFNLVNTMAKTVMGLKLGAVPISLFSETPGFGLAKPIAERHQTLLPSPAAFPRHAVFERCVGRKETDTVKRWGAGSEPHGGNAEQRRQSPAGTNRTLVNAGTRIACDSVELHMG